MLLDLKKSLAAVIASFLLIASSTAYAAETRPPSVTISVAAEPARYTFVKGDASKFRAIHWMDDGFAGGIKEFSLEDELSDDVKLEIEGHGIPQDGNYEGLVSITKEDFGYIHFDYEQFRKYYANGGGFYRPFTLLSQNYTDKELALNIGKFGVEAGLTLKDLPEIMLKYEREFRQGTKSRLSWTSVTDTVNGASVTKKIGPSWQEIDEIVDSFDVRLSDVFQGFNWNADQHWAFARAKNMREETQLSSVSSANVSDSNRKIRDQFTEPRSSDMATTLGVDKWLFKEKVHVSTNYRFAQIQSRELENIYEYDQNRVLTNFSNAEQVRDAYSDNLLTSQTWVTSFMTTFLNPLTVIARLKAEAAHRNSESTYPKDKSPNNNNGTSKPDGIIDQIDVSNNQEKQIQWGESVSLRYTGIPRVAIYNDYEFQQDRSNLYEDRQSSSAGEVFNRQDIAYMQRGVGTLGAQFIPWNRVTMTVQGRHRLDDISYDHVRYTNNSTSGAKSVFIDEQTLETDEAEARVSWKPCKLFQPTFRYQLTDKTYKTTGLPNSDIANEAALIASGYTWDLVSQPLDDLLLMVSFSFQDGKIMTPARFDTTAATDPTFDYDSYSSLFSAEYSVTKDVTLTATADYIRASNFNDFSSVGLPLGADFHQADMIFGARWTVKKDLTIEPKYGYYQYRANQSEVGSFNAHEFWLEVKSKWG